MFEFRVQNTSGNLVWSTEYTPLSVAETRTFTQSGTSRVTTVTLSRSYNLRDVIVGWNVSNSRYMSCTPLANSLGQFSQIRVQTVAIDSNRNQYPSANIEVVVATKKIQGIVATEGYGLEIFDSTGALTFSSNSQPVKFCSAFSYNRNGNTISLPYFGDDASRNKKKYLTAFTTKQDMALAGGNPSQGVFGYSFGVYITTNVTSQNVWPASPNVLPYRQTDIVFIHDGTRHPPFINSDIGNSVGVFAI